MTKHVTTETLFHWNASHNERKGNKRRKRDERTQRTAIWIRTFPYLSQDQFGFVTNVTLWCCNDLSIFRFLQTNSKVEYNRFNNISFIDLYFDIQPEPSIIIIVFKASSSCISFCPHFKEGPKTTKINYQRQMINFVLFFCKKHTSGYKKETETCYCTLLFTFKFIV